ncbi:hypothetical protein LCGC14_3116380, partial [marine sediment metagenome]
MSCSISLIALPLPRRLLRRHHRQNRPLAHHALHVLRLKAGAEVELFDGRGAVAAGVIAQASRKGVTVRVAQPLKIAGRRGPVVHVAFALPKGKRLDWLLEKATELGAASLRPIGFHRSIPGAGRSGTLSPAQRDRWFTHCVAAGKQCGLSWLPVIEEYEDDTETEPRDAETLGEQYSISRREQDRYACLSQTRCQDARRRGVFDDEINHLAQEFGDRETAAKLVEQDHKLVRFYIPTNAR